MYKLKNDDNEVLSSIENLDDLITKDLEKIYEEYSLKSNDNNEETKEN